MIYPNYPCEVLKIGSTGKDVKLVQGAINVLFSKYPICDNLNDDGVFEKETEKSVKEIQRAVDLSVNGIIDQKTWNTIFAIANFIGY